MSTHLSSEYSTLSLSFMMRKPTHDAKHPPLVILLHGYGSNEADLFGLAKDFPPEFMVILARAPYTLSLGQYAWFALNYSSGAAVHDAVQAESSRLALKRFIDEVSNEFKVDTERVFLVGFSQGAIMSYSVGLTYPQLVRGIGALSGRLLEEIKPMINISRKAGEANIEVFLAHGVLDKVLPVERAREAKSYLVGLDVSLTYNEYEIPHTISTEESQALIKWLLRVNT